MHSQGLSQTVRLSTLDFDVTGGDCDVRSPGVSESHALDLIGEHLVSDPVAQCTTGPVGCWWPEPGVCCATVEVLGDFDVWSLPDAVGRAQYVLDLVGSVLRRIERCGMIQTHVTQSTTR